ncbi:MAG: antiporter, family [Gemmatimonadales bacterium]|nr:antiporter, family [Gemmatimonadales bacterium]
MTIKQFLSTADGPAVAAATAAGTVMITFQIAGKATRDALFLSSFGVDALPAMVIAAAVVSAVVSVLLARVMARSRPSRLVPRLFGLSAVLLLAEWALVVQARRPAAAILYLHFTALGALLVSGFWAIVTERFDPRTARRTISYITAGGSVGGLLGGVLPERVGATLSLTAMLPILAGLHLIAALLVLGVEHGATHPTTGQERFLGDEPQLGAARILRASPYLMGLALLMTLTSAAEGVLDYVFKAQASLAAASGEELLRLFAVFYTVTALLGISIQVTTLRRVLGRLGIARSAALLPAGVSLGAVGALIVPGLTSVLLARGAEVVLRSSIFRAAYELLFTPVAPREKRATKLLIDVVAARLGDIAGGALIAAALVLVGAAADRILLGVTVALGLGALVVARRLHLGYVSALEGSLQRRAGEVPDPLQDEGSALLQTVGGFDLSGIRQRAGFASASTGVPTAVPDPVPSAPTSPLRQSFDSGNAGEIQRALATQPITPDLVEPAIELLAWDEVAPHAIKALRSVARTETAVFARHLLDPAEDFAIRRRLVTVLAASRRTEAFESLFEAMRDRRFEVRYRSARALSYLAGEIPGLQIDRDRVFEVVLREMAVERNIWETRQLIDLPEDDTSPMEAEVLRGRASRSLEHLFTLLSLVLPAETVRLAFHSLHTDDRHLRGTALEYLETVLPEAVWQRLRPFLDDGEFEATRPGRSSGQAMQELLASQESIVLALADLRRREGK